ncbi:MAG: hypothetical protein EXR28_16935, partial [Betaproteobacteria bacterium]|nr:hypothetical protein [Betaproteobacteria bacterium]
MDFTVGVLLGTFVLSVFALFFFIWSMAQGLFGDNKPAATEIFARNEFGIVEDPSATAEQYGDLQQEMNSNDQFYAYFDEAMLAATRARLAVRRQQHDDADRIRADDSTAGVVGVCLTLAVVWLVFASFAGLISSIKLHAPDWWVQYEWLTFGRMRAMHTSMVAYGWCSLAGIGVALWLIPRLLKTVLVGAKYALVGGALWTTGVFAGTVAIGMGHSDGLEWLEFP